MVNSVKTTSIDSQTATTCTTSSQTFISIQGLTTTSDGNYETNGKGTVNLDVNWNIPVGKTLTIKKGDTLNIFSKLTVNGKIIVQGVLNNLSANTLNITGTGEVTVEKDATLNNGNGFFLNGKINNRGIIIVNGCLINSSNSIICNPWVFILVLAQIQINGKFVNNGRFISDGFQVGLVSDENRFNDNSFNKSAYNGLVKAQEEFRVQINIAESTSAEDFAPNLQALIDASSNIIFAVGFNLVADVNLFAAANPDFNFVILDGWSEGNDNLKPVVYNMAESSYLAGYLAAAYSTSKVVGTYGGLQIPSVTDYMTSFYYGAKAYAADFDKEVTVLGWNPIKKTGQFIGGFETNSSKSIATDLIENNADVIFPVAGDQYGDVSEAIKESNSDVVMIGVDKNIALTSPDYKEYVLTSVEKRMTNAVYDIIKLSVEGRFDNKTYVGTLANGGTGLSPFYDFDKKISDELKDRLVEIEDEIISGKRNLKI